MTQDNQEDDDILLKLSMAGKSLRIKPSEAPELPEQKPSSQPTPLPQPVSSSPSSPPPVPSSSPQIAKPSTVHQPQRETNTIVPPANTPPKSEEAQNDILRKLTMKPKDYTAASPTIAQVKNMQHPSTHSYQTPEEAKSNKPYVSSHPEVEQVRKLAQNIYGSDMVQKRLQKKK